MDNVSGLTSQEVRRFFQDVASSQENISEIPTALLRSLGRITLDARQQEKARSSIHRWVAYAKDNGVLDNPFAIRYHVPRFATKEYGQERCFEPLLEVPLSSLDSGGRSYADILSCRTDPKILSEPGIAIVGGTARLALKMYSGIDIRSELPINDIDAVIASDAGDVAKKAEHYGIDLSGAKVVDGKIGEILSEIVTNFDCTMNQVAVYGNKLLFTQTALNDVREGNIRLIANSDPLFGSDGVALPHGNVYVNRKGFYRGLGFLVREKGRTLIVSQENIEQEKANIGRYWQVLLNVKLLPMGDDEARYRAIGNWHELAKRIGSTQTADPKAFLEELRGEYPGTVAGRRTAYDNIAQARWIIEKLIGRGVQELYESEPVILPKTYTPANLSLAPSFPDYDFNEFMKYASVR